jgi:YfiH family protein
MDTAEILIPTWNVPEHVKAFVSLRKGGYSIGRYQGLNLATHVADNKEHVERNRAILTKQFILPKQPTWLNQTHSTKIVELPANQQELIAEADGAWTQLNNEVCAVLTADCLPVFFYHHKENKIAVTHAGWRGLLNGIIENTIIEMTSTPEYLEAWLGPAIGAEKFEVGEEVRAAFCDLDNESKQCFEFVKEVEKKKYYLADIYQLAKRRLYNSGVTSISGGDFCTVSDKERFFSYRRDGETGRMVNLIWMSEK